MAGVNDSKQYFSSIADKIDRLEGRKPLQTNVPTEGEVSYSSGEVYDVSIIDPSTNSEDVPVNELLPKISSFKIDGVIDLYKELNQKYNLKFDADSVNDIGKAFKEIIDPDKRDTYTIYLRENIDRLSLVCLGQLANTIYILIGKLTNPEVIESLTISERVVLLDKMFEYMDKINNMKKLIPNGDSKLELREIANRKPENDSGGKYKVRNRELEEYVLKILSS